MIAGNHELSFDPSTIEEARDYMRQAGEERNMDKVVTNILNVYLIIVELRSRSRSGPGQV